MPFYIAKPIYEVNAMIEIGQIDNKPIENLNAYKTENFLINIK